MKTKTANSALKNWADVDAAVGKALALRAEIAKKREQHTLAVQNKLAALSAAINPIAIEVETLEQNVQSFCTAHRAEMVDERVMNLSNGVVRFRKLKAALQPITGKTWDAIVEKIRSMTDKTWTHLFIRQKNEVNKPVLLSAIVKKDVTPADMKRMGIEIAEGEQFEIASL